MNLRAAVYQTNHEGLDPQHRLERLAKVLGGTDVDVLLCPESFATGYRIGERVAELAEPAEGLFMQAVAELARETGTALIYGFPERNGGSIHNSANVISAEGQRIATHRKLMLPPGFERETYQEGERHTLFDIGGLRCGLLICYDVEFPEGARALTRAGAQVLFVCTALSAPYEVVARCVVPARAFENGVWVLYANHCGAEGGAGYAGLSCIVAPSGEVVSQAGYSEAVLLTDIDPEAVAKARETFSYSDEASRFDTIKIG